MHQNRRRTRSRGETLSRKEVLTIAREMLGEDGDTLTCRRFCRETGLSAERIVELFGSWRRLLRAAGRVRGGKSRRLIESRRELLDRLRSVCLKLGDAVLLEQFTRRTGVTIHQIRRHFGSWGNMRVAAGLSRRTRLGKHYSDRELLDDLLRVYLLTGRSPSVRNQERKGRFAPNTYKSRFGTWEFVKLLFEMYRRAYFTSLDPDWDYRLHKVTFRPGPHHKLAWPPDKAGVPWDPIEGFRPPV